MAYLIWLDEAGQEMRREVKGRGRPPRGSKRGEDGNFYVSFQLPDKQIYYITKDGEGNVLDQEPKGRGRPRPGFVKEPDGNWYHLEV